MFSIISHWILLRMENVSSKIYIENQNTHFVFNNFFFLKSCRLWDNVEKYSIARQATDENIIRRMRFACWITKATDTLRICNTYCIFTATMVTRTRLSVIFIRTLPVLPVTRYVQYISITSKCTVGRCLMKTGVFISVLFLNIFLVEEWCCSWQMLIASAVCFCRDLLAPLWYDLYDFSSFFITLTSSTYSFYV